MADLATLQRWIAERRSVREDEVSREGGPFTRLGLLPDLAPILGLVEAADRAARQPARAASVDPFGRAGLDEPPVQPLAPPPRAAPPAPPPAAPAEGPLSASPRQPAVAPVPAAKAAAIAPAQEALPLDDAELATVRRKRGPLGMVAAGALLAVLRRRRLALLSGRRGRSAADRRRRPARPPRPSRRPAPAPAPAPAEAAASTPALSQPPAATPAATPPPPENAPPGPLPEKGAAAPASEPSPAAADPARKPAGVKARLAAARGLRERGSTSQALDGYQRLLREEPENVEALTGRGLCYFELNQFGPAEASFQRALALAPDASRRHHGARRDLPRRRASKAEAAALYQRYLAAHPDGEEAAVARNALSQLKE